MKEQNQVNEQEVQEKELADKVAAYRRALESLGEVIDAIDLPEDLGLHNKARDLAELAQWYKDFGEPLLSEYHRYAHRTVLDFIDQMRFRGCATPGDVRELAEYIKYETYNKYKHYQSEGFTHFAELAMVKFKTLGSIAADIKRNF